MALLAACLIALLALAPAAMAGGPANSEYTLTVTGGKEGSAGGRIGDSGGSSILPVLLIGGAAVASGGAAVAYVRHRRRSGEAM